MTSIVRRTITFTLSPERQTVELHELTMPVDSLTFDAPAILFLSPGVNAGSTVGTGVNETAGIGVEVGVDDGGVGEAGVAVRVGAGVEPLPPPTDSIIVNTRALDSTEPPES